MRTVDELTARILEFREARDWKKFHTPKDMALSLMLEAGELAELFQWKNDAEMNAVLRDKKEELGDELADVLYWVLLIAADAGLDLTDAFERKMKKNIEKYPVDKCRGRHEKYSVI